MHLSTGMSHLVAFACTAAGIFAFVGYIRGFLKKAHQQTVEATAKALVGEISERTKQLVPNGGSSLRDDVTAIRNEQGELRRTVAAQGQQIATLVEVVHAINGRFDDRTDVKPAG